MKDGSDAGGRLAAPQCVGKHRGGGIVGFEFTTAVSRPSGTSLHAGQVTVADGTEMMAKRIERVLTTDPGWESSVMFDAGMTMPKSSAKNKGA